MAKFILEVPEGHTECEHCPFADSQFCYDNLDDVAELDCHSFNLSTITIKQIED